MSSNQRNRGDAGLRRLSRAVIQLAQAQAEVDAQATHKEQPARGKRTDGATPKKSRKRDQA